MVYGCHPFQDENSVVSIDKILSKDEVKFPKSVPVTDQCKNLIKQMLNKDRKDRATIFSIFSHPWLELTDEQIEEFAEKFQKSHKLMKHLPIHKEHTFASALGDMRVTPPSNDLFFEMSSANVPMISSTQIEEPKITNSPKILERGPRPRRKYTK